MLDRLFIGDTPATEVLFRPDYDPQDVVLSEKLSNPSGQNLVALFPPWHGGGGAYDIFVDRLTRKNYAVLAFEYDDQQLTHDADQVLESFLTLADKSAERVNRLAYRRQYGRITLVGASLGTPALAMTASRLERFDSATLITPGANLADCMWHGIRTQRVRRELEANGVDLETLDAKWQQIAPVNHIAAMQGKKVKVKISATDKVIPTRSQEQYVAALVEAGIDPSVIVTRQGHYGAIGSFCLTGKL